MTSRQRSIENPGIRPGLSYQQAIKSKPAKWLPGHFLGIVLLGDWKALRGDWATDHLDESIEVLYPIPTSCYSSRLRGRGVRCQKTFACRPVNFLDPVSGKKTSRPLNYDPQLCPEGSGMLSSSHSTYLMSQCYALGMSFRIGCSPGTERSSQVQNSRKQRSFSMWYPVLLVLPSFQVLYMPLSIVRATKAP